jgi:hypothetical protein
MSAAPPAAKRFPRKTPEAHANTPPATLIDARIAELADWRGQRLGQLRTLIMAADPKITEDWKWNVPVWSCAGIICTGEAYKKVVKLTFARGARLADPARLFNSSLEGKIRRAIDFSEASAIDETALAALVRAAAALNQSSPRGKAN